MSHALSAGADLVAATQCYHVREIRYAINGLLKKLRKILISASRKYVAAATGSSPFKVRDNQRPERTMSGVRKPSPESSVPGDNLTRGSRRNQLRRGHGSPPVLSEVPHELSTAAHSKECKRSPQQFIPAGFPLTTTSNQGRKTQTDPLSTPYMVRSGRVRKNLKNISTRLLTVLTMCVILHLEQIENHL